MATNSTTVNRRIWEAACSLGHGFTLCHTENGRGVKTLPPDFSLSREDFDDGCCALDKAREDSWPSISCWPSTADGGASWLTISNRTRIRISGNGDTLIESCEAGFPGAEGGKADGTITIRGRQTTFAGRPSSTAWSVANAIADAEDHVADSHVAADRVRGFVAEDSFRTSTLACAIETAPVALPRSVLLAGIDAIEQHIEKNLPAAHRVLLRLRA